MNQPPGNGQQTEDSPGQVDDDLCLVTVTAALGVGWWLDRQQLVNNVRAADSQAREMSQHNERDVMAESPAENKSMPSERDKAKRWRPTTVRWD